MVGMHLMDLSHHRFQHTVRWAIVVSAIIVAIASLLARATLNVSAALTDKPDIALYLLLPEEKIGRSSVLREQEKQRDYLAETKDGTKLIILKKGERQWYVASMEKLHGGR